MVQNNSQTDLIYYMFRGIAKVRDSEMYLIKTHYFWTNTALIAYKP